MNTPTTDRLGVTIEVGDKVIVSAYGWSVRLIDVGQFVTVTGFTAQGNVQHDSADVANGKAIRPTCLIVRRRDGVNGHEGNLPVYREAFHKAMREGGRA